MKIKNVNQIVSSIIPGSKTPARYYFDEKVILINTPVFAKLNQEQKLFVLLHEAGHAHLQTKNEIEADKFALVHYLKQGGRLTQALYVLTNNLSSNDPESFERIIQQFNNLVEYDIKENNNLKLQYMNIPEIQNDFITADENYNEFLGRLFKRDPEKKAARQARKEARTNVINARAERIASGEHETFMDKLTGSVKDILGGGDQGSNLSDIDLRNMPEPPKKNNTTTIIIIVVVVLLIAVTAFFLLRKKKK